MRPFELHAAIYAPPDEVADCLTDPDLLRAWQPCVLSASRRDASTLLVRRAVRGRARAERWTVTRPRPDACLVRRPYGPATLTVLYTVATPDPRTHVTARFELAVAPLARPLATWLERGVRRAEADQLTRLKLLLEGEDVAAVHAPPDPRGD